MNKYDIIALALVIALPVLAGAAFLAVGHALSDFADKTHSTD